MRTTEKVRAGEKRSRKATEREISVMNLARHNETKIVQKFISLKVNDKLTIQVTESKYQQYGRDGCINMWLKRKTA